MIADDPAQLRVDFGSARCRRSNGRPSSDSSFVRLPTTQMFSRAIVRKIAGRQLLIAASDQESLAAREAEDDDGALRRQCVASARRIGIRGEQVPVPQRRRNRATSVRCRAVV